MASTCLHLNNFKHGRPSSPTRLHSPSGLPSSLHYTEYTQDVDSKAPSSPLCRLPGSFVRGLHSGLMQRRIVNTTLMGEEREDRRDTEEDEEEDKQSRNDYIVVFSFQSVTTL